MRDFRAPRHQLRQKLTQMPATPTADQAATHRPSLPGPAPDPSHTAAPG